MDSYSCCCYFPTTALFVDDRKNFLESLTLNLDENLSYRTFIDPDEAINLLHTNDQPKRLFQQWLSSFGSYVKGLENLDADFPLELNTNFLLELLYSPDRFREITVAVVDYAMPKMNGLEFCKQLNSLLIKKLMITGEASDAVAVTAFNEGLIDKFIRKQANDFYEALHITIHQLQKLYFGDMTKSIKTALIDYNDCWLSDPLFTPLFTKTLKSLNIIEYYLIDAYGSFLMLDGNGKMYWLAVKSAKIVEDFYDIAEEHEAPVDIQKKLKEKSHLPFFFDQQDLEAPVEKWDRYLHPAQILKGEKQNFYYALIEGTSVYNISQENIVSYNDYLELL